MKRIPWLKYLPIILVAICFVPVAIAQTKPIFSVQIAQASAEYNRYMKQGYAATARRDYQTALINFRRALQVRAGDRFARNAINNVSKYVNRRSPSKIGYVPPNWGAPGNRIGAAVRGCSVGSNSQENPLIALLPANNTGTTTAAYPVLLFYIPQIAEKKLEFSLLDENDNKIYQTAFNYSRTPGIVSLNLSAFEGLPPLKIDKKYHWYFTIVCNPQDRSADSFVDGWVQRIEVDPALASELKKVIPRDRASLYALNGIWYDAAAALYEVRQSNPNNSLLKDEWADLLKSIGLDTIAREPLIPCCTVRN